MLTSGPVMSPTTHAVFLDRGRSVATGRLPLFARRPMQGSVSGRHASPHRGSSVEFAEYRKYVPGDDLRRLDWRAYGRSDRFYVKEFEADTNLRCCLVVDTSGSMDFGSQGVTKIEYARRMAGTLGYLACQQGDAVGLACVADGIVRSLPPKRNAAHLQAVFDMLERDAAAGRDATGRRAARTGRDDPPAGAGHDYLGPVRRAGIARQLLSAPALSAGTTWRCFICSIRWSSNSTFRRPMRFLDMEGGPAIFAEPNDIADRYQKALHSYLDELKQVVLESAIDYQRVSLDEDYEQVLVRFLVGRAAAKGAAMSFLQPWLLAALPLGGAADHHSPGQSAALPDHQLGGHDVPAGGPPDVARLFAAAAMADHAVRGWRRSRDWCWRSAGRWPAAGSGWLPAAAPIRRSCCSIVRPACSSASPAGGSKLETGRGSWSGRSRHWARTDGS